MGGTTLVQLVDVTGWFVLSIVRNHALSGIMLAVKSWLVPGLITATKSVPGYLQLLGYDHGFKPDEVAYNQ